MRGVLNAGLLAFSMIVGAACLWAASHARWEIALLAVVFFAMINNMPFALMHEAVHGTAAKSGFVNATIGVVAGWAFPTSFTLQTVAHQGHHQRNRTDHELYDYYLPDESRLKRNIWLYAGNLLGLYWWSMVCGNLLFALVPWIFRSHRFVGTIAPALGFGPYVKDMAAQPLLKPWLEVVAAFAFQALLFLLLDLSLLSFVLCHGAFALHWSVLQYADHAWSARDVRNGAWNLKVLPVSRWLALNYHYHLAHHQHPQVPWYELPKWVDKASRQPSFWRVYFSLWKGVRPAPPMGAPSDLAFLFPPDQPTR